MTMIQVTVGFHGYIRDVVSEAKVKLSLTSKATLGDLFNLLSERYGDKFRERVLAGPNEFQGGVAVFAGSKAVDDLGIGLADEIKENDELTILVIPMVSGGLVS